MIYMGFDYLYEAEHEKYIFYRTPKMLFTEERFEPLSTDARILYGILLDRTGLSRENGWKDEAGHIYIIFTIKAIKRYMKCQNSKACDLLKELEAFGLIERVHQGVAKPTLIYVKDFMRFRKTETDGSENQNHMIPENRTERFRKPESNKNDDNNTDNKKTYPILSGKFVDNSDIKGTDKDEDRRRAYREFFCEQLSIDTLYEMYPFHTETIEAILDLILDIVCSARKTIRIAGDDKPVEVVRSQFMKLNQLHISYVLDCMKENGSKIRNIKQYLLSALYNAPFTMQSYYQAKVNNDIINKIFD